MIKQQNIVHNQVWVNSSTWQPITTLESPSIMPTTDTELIVSLGGTKPGRKDPPELCMKGGGVGWYCQAPRDVYPFLSHKWLGDSCYSSRMHCQHNAVGLQQLLGALLARAKNHHHDTHFPAMAMLWRFTQVQMQIDEAHWFKLWLHQSLKIERQHCNIKYQWDD